MSDATSVTLSMPGSNFSYRVEAADVLWLMRAVEYEGPVQAQVAAVLINKFLTVKGGGFNFLAEFIRNYAQPINPHWFVGGVNYEKEVDRNHKASLLPKTDPKGNPNPYYEPDNSAKLLKEAAKRPGQADTSIFSAETARAVKQALKGNTAIQTVPYATEYGARSLINAREADGWTCLNKTPGTTGNALFSVPANIPPGAYVCSEPADPEEIERIFTDVWNFQSVGADVRATIGNELAWYSYKDSAGKGRTTYQYREKGSKDRVPAVSGTHSVAIGQAALQTAMAARRRALDMQGLSPEALRVKQNEQSTKFNSVAAELFTTKVTRLVSISEAVLHLTVVINAIGIEPATGEWVTSTNTTTLATNTAPQPTGTVSGT